MRTAVSRRAGVDFETVCEDNLGGGQFARPSGIMVDEATGELRAGVFQFTPATAIGV